MSHSTRAAFAALALALSARIAGAQTTVTLQSPSSDVVFATIRAGAYANTRQGATLETKNTTDLNVMRRAMLKFDTENRIPKGAAITSAELTVTVAPGAGAVQSRRIGAYQVTMSWDETEVTWNRRRTSPDQRWYSAGGDLGTRLAEKSVSSAAGTKVTFDVTPLVAQAVSGALGSSRYTRIALVDIDPPDGESRRIYYTPNDPNVSNRPTLRVTYGGAAAPPPDPDPVPTASTGSTLKVLEYNVHHGGWGTDGRLDIDRVIDVIVKINPHIISLCEMEKGTSWYSGDGAATYKAKLEARTGAKWYSWDAQDYGDWNSNGIRNVILSRIPFTSTYRHEFSVGKDRTVAGVAINVNGRNINFMSNHFDPDSATNRVTQAKELVSYANNFAENRIMLGDFNDQPYSTAMAAILAKYYDGWAEAVKKGAAYSPPDNPNGYTRNSRIDYVFYSRGEANLTLKSVEVIETRSSSGVMPSDHRPLVATFTVQ
jgi:endonuclease/exonuclease/phosphatase family metal-dependent hydrolase